MTTCKLNFLILILAFLASTAQASGDPLDDEFYLKDPGETVIEKIEELTKVAKQLRKIGEEGVEKATPLAALERKLAVQEKEQEWLRIEYIESKDYMTEQNKINQSVAATLKFCTEAVKDLKGRWNLVYGLISGIFLTLLAWYLAERWGRKGVK